MGVKWSSFWGQACGLSKAFRERSERMTRPVCKLFLNQALRSLHQRIRSRGLALAKMAVARRHPDNHSGLSRPFSFFRFCRRRSTVRPSPLNPSQAGPPAPFAGYPSCQTANTRCCLFPWLQSFLDLEPPENPERFKHVGHTTVLTDRCNHKNACNAGAIHTGRSTPPT
jgi:hypothetical protein